MPSTTPVPLPNFGSNMGLDGIENRAGEVVHRPLPPVIRMAPTVQKKIDALWDQLGIVKKP